MRLTSIDQHTASTSTELDAKRVAIKFSATSDRQTHPVTGTPATTATATLPRPLKKLENRLTKFIRSRRVPKDDTARAAVKALKGQARKLRQQIHGSAQPEQTTAGPGRLEDLLLAGRGIFRAREQAKAPALARRLQAFQASANGQAGLTADAITKLTQGSTPDAQHEGYVLGRRLLQAERLDKRIQTALPSMNGQTGLAKKVQDELHSTDPKTLTKGLKDGRFLVRAQELVEQVTAQRMRFPSGDKRPEQTIALLHSNDPKTVKRGMARALRLRDRLQTHDELEAMMTELKKSPPAWFTKNESKAQAALKALKPEVRHKKGELGKALERAHKFLLLGQLYAVQEALKAADPTSDVTKRKMAVLKEAEAFFAPKQDVSPGTLRKVKKMRARLQRLLKNQLRINAGLDTRPEADQHDVTTAMPMVKDGQANYGLTTAMPIGVSAANNHFSVDEPVPAPGPAAKQTTGTRPKPAHKMDAKVAALPAEFQAFGQYQLEKLLGEGGMGAVYKGTHTTLDKPVAVKLIKPDMPLTPQALQRFKLEVRAVGKLEHPNIVGAMDAGEINGVPYLVMPFVAGQDLDAILRQNGPMSPKEAAEILKQAAKGVRFAHEQGIIHRDLKPSNMFRTPDGTVKVIDFGLARLSASEQQDADQQGDGPTRTGHVVGTVHYMAPDQARGKASAKSDIYALGCVLHALLTGRPPYQRATVMESLMAHVQDDIPKLDETRVEVLRRRSGSGSGSDDFTFNAGLSDVKNDVPPALVALHRALLDKDPAKRPTLDAVIEQLDTMSFDVPAEPAGKRRGRKAPSIGERIRQMPLALKLTLGGVLATAVGGPTWFALSGNNSNNTLPKPTDNPGLVAKTDPSVRNPGSQTTVIPILKDTPPATKTDTTKTPGTGGSPPPKAKHKYDPTAVMADKDLTDFTRLKRVLTLSDSLVNDTFWPSGDTRPPETTFELVRSNYKGDNALQAKVKIDMGASSSCPKSLNPSNSEVVSSIILLPYNRVDIYSWANGQNGEKGKISQAIVRYDAKSDKPTVEFIIHGNKEGSKRDLSADEARYVSSLLAEQLTKGVK